MKNAFLPLNAKNNNPLPSLADFQTVRRGYLQRGTRNGSSTPGEGSGTGEPLEANHNRQQPEAIREKIQEEKTRARKDPEEGQQMDQEKKTKKKRETRPRVLLDVSMFPHDEKGRAIVPDEFMVEHYRELPDGTINESGTKRVYSGGMLSILGADPERDREIHKAGGEALQATLKQRKTLAESIEIALRQKATKEVLQALNLPEGSSNQEAITAAIILQASSGNTKAFTALRDTIGEMPTTKTEISADIMTAADRALIEKLQKRIDG